MDHMNPPPAAPRRTDRNPDHRCPDVATASGLNAKVCVSCVVRAPLKFSRAWSSDKYDAPCSQLDCSQLDYSILECIPPDMM